MAHNVELDPGVGGATIVTVDLSLNTYPSTGELPASCLYVSANATTAPTPVTAANALYVQPGSGATFAVSAASLPLPSGAATSANQTTELASLASIDGKITAVNTGAVVVSSSALPSGASTSAKQPALGTAGTASTDVITIQGIASMTPLLATLSGTNNIATVTTVSTITNVVHVDDNSGSLTIDNAALSVTGGGVEASALRVTIASDSTGVVSVDDNGGSLTVDGTVAVSGTVTVGTHAVTQSGTWTVQPGNTANTTPWLMSIHDGTTKANVIDLTTRDALAVALVDTNGDQISSFGGGTQYTEDAAAAANPVGTAPILVRKDTPTSEVSADGDNIAARGTAYGAQYVTLLDTGGSPVSVGGGTQYTEDAAAAANPIGNSLMLVREDARAGSLTTADGDNVAARGTNAGELYVKHVDTIPVTQSGTWNVGTVTTVTTVSTVTAVSDAQVQGKAAQDAAVSGNPVLVGGRASSAAPTDMSADGDAVHVWLTRKGAVNIADAGGSITIDGAVSQSGTWDIGTVTDVSNVSNADCQGKQDHDAALGTTRPITIGMYAKAAAPTDVSADGDSVHVWALRNGSQVVNLAVGGTLVTGSAGLPVAQQGTWNITNAGTFAVQATVAAAATNIAKAEDVASADADVGVPAMAVRKATPANTSGTDGDYEMLQMSAGRLWVDPSGVTLTVASHAVTNAGTFAVQVDGNALTSLQLIDDCIFSDDAAFTPGTSKVAVIGAQADESSTDSVDEGDAGALRMTLDRKLITTPLPHTAGGCSIFRSIDIDETEEDVKTSAGQVYAVHCMNATNAAIYLKFYNATAANTTVGSTTPVATFLVPGNNDSDGAGFVLTLPTGWAFDTAICVAATTGVADADTGAPAANACIVHVHYK